MSIKEPPAFPFTQTSPASISTRLRRLRKSRGWTLSDVEKRSHGNIKAVVLGSYERGDRSMSVERAIEIANLFGIPLAQLLTEPHGSAKDSSEHDGLPKKMVIDLRRAKSAIYETQDSSEQFTLFLAWIIGLRQDWNGEILSLRKSDLETLSLMMFRSSGSVLEWMRKYQLLIPYAPSITS